MLAYCLPSLTLQVLRFSTIEPFLPKSPKVTPTPLYKTHIRFLPRFLTLPENNTARAFFWFLLGILILLGAFLILGEKPWNPELQESIQERTEAGKLWRIDDYSTYIGWIAAAINLVLVIALFVTLRLWSKATSPRSKSIPKSNFSAKRWMMFGLAIAVFTGGYLRLQRLDHSLWNDEEYTVRNHIWGEMEVSDDGKLKYDPLPWHDTFFRNKINNHLGYTIPTRFLHDNWAKFRATDERPFSGPVLRLLPFLASLGSILLIGILGVRYANPIAGIGAAFFLALNPWHLRYSVEARGYSQAIFFLLLACLFLIPAIRSGRWRYWLGFAASELLVMLCVLGTMHALLVMNFFAVAVILFSKSKWHRENRAVIISRLLVANSLAAIIFIQFIAPAIPQILDYMENGPLAGELSLSWWREVWILFISGLSSNNPMPAHHTGTAFSTQVENFPALGIYKISALLSITVLGLASAIKNRSWLLLPIVATIGGAGLAYLQNELSGNIMHPWYVVYIIVGFTLLIALGATTLLTGIQKLASRFVRIPPPIAQTTLALGMALFLASYALSTSTSRDLLMEQSRQPLREVVEAVRGGQAYGEKDENLITAVFGTSKRMLTSYDPRVQILDNPADLEAIINQAKTSNKALIIYHCGYLRAQEEEPDMLAIVDNPQRFEELTPVLGLEELFSYRIYRLIEN